MAYLVTLLGYKPAARASVKWTSVGVYEAPDVAGAPGAFVLIDTQALADYADPAHPPSYDLETVNATAASGLWYRVEFRDTIGGLQESEPEYNGLAAVPDVVWVRATSNVDFGELGYPDPATGDPDRLQYVLDEAVPEFTQLTGVDPLRDALPDGELRLTRMAIRMLVEYHAASGQMEQLETAADYDMLSSMTASDYSETRRGVTRPNPQVLHPWPALNRLLEQIVDYGAGGPAPDGVGMVVPRDECRRGGRLVSNGSPVWPWPPYPSPRYPLGR